MFFCFTDRLNCLATIRDCLMLVFCGQRVTIVLRLHHSGTASKGDKPLTTHIALTLNHAQMNRGYDPDVCFSSPEMLTLEPSCLCEKGIFTQGDRTWQLSHHPLCSRGLETDLICVCPVYYFSQENNSHTNLLRACVMGLSRTFLCVEVHQGSWIKKYSSVT